MRVSNRGGTSILGLAKELEGSELGETGDPRSGDGNGEEGTEENSEDILEGSEERTEIMEGRYILEEDRFRFNFLHAVQGLVV
jgi:hypothetical protein